ncbi:unnamed protein product [Candida verbasci]|uniref:cyanamide hydratase n=1 Tax=Candida verbasci TaxID=1227364 RepID=A0A9W4XK59_9ASCO|nr:unnamed protein product [Candida verbasci]
MTSIYGFDKIERDVEKAIPNKRPPTAQLNTELPLKKPLSKFIHDYAKEKLPIEAFNHSVRVYLYSLAIIHDQFPDWKLDHEVIFVTSLLHDIGTTDHNLKATKMSFEFYGGIISRDLILKQTDCNQEFADAVTEAIIRHQDLGESGYITTLGLILQISTILDNVGKNTDLIHKDTLNVINKKYSREGWLSCFANVIESENKLKPWSHTTSLGINDFKSGVLGNKVNYEKL